MNYIVKAPEEIGVYVQTSNIKTIDAVKKEIGADVICNFQLFTIATREANFVLKVDGKVIGNDGCNYYGYGWNKNDRTLTFTTASQMDKFDNFAGCIYVLKDGKVRNLKAGIDYPTALGGKRGRTCIGTKADGSIVIYCWSDGSSGACRMEDLGQKMLDLGCVNAVNFDGGGSTQLICPDGKVTTSRAIYNFLYFKLEQDNVNSNDKQEQMKPVCPYAEPTHNIMLGSRGEGAKWVQWMLNQHGCKLTVDGIIGLLSRKAIIDFQRKNGLAADGICGILTRAKLKD